MLRAIVIYGALSLGLMGIGATGYMSSRSGPSDGRGGMPPILREMPTDDDEVLNFASEHDRRQFYDQAQRRYGQDLPDHLEKSLGRTVFMSWDKTADRPGSSV